MLRLLAAALAIVALLAAGCGSSDSSSSGESKSDYTKQIDSARTTLNDTFTAIGKDIGKGSTAQQIGAKLDEGAKALTDAAQRFKAIDPPSDAKSAQGELVTGLQELAGVFSKSADQARTGNTAALAKSLQDVQASAGAKKITEATEHLRKAGYKLAGTT